MGVLALCVLLPVVSVVRCWLLVVNWSWLLVVGCRCLLFVVCCSLWLVVCNCCLLRAVSLFRGRCFVVVVCCCLLAVVCRSLSCVVCGSLFVACRLQRLFVCWMPLVVLRLGDRCATFVVRGVLFAMWCSLS